MNKSEIAERAARSMTWGDLPDAVRTMCCNLQPPLQPHEWDNMNISEQRDWAIKQLDISERFLNVERSNHQESIRLWEKSERAIEESRGQPPDLGIADVWHKGTKSYYRAKLLKKLTLEEALFDPTGPPDGEPSSAPPALEPNHHWKWFREIGQKLCPQAKEQWHKESPHICLLCEYAKKVAELYTESRAAQEVSPAQPGKGEAMSVTFKLTIAFIIIGLGAAVASHDYFAGMLQVVVGSFLAAVLITKAIGRGGVTR